MSTTKAGPNAPVDFVINFSIAPTKATSADSKAKSTQAIEEEYLKLLGVLKDAGLEAKGRSGGQGTDSVLIFVRASEERVQAEIQRERLSDWLNGVATTRPSPRTPRDFSAEPIHSSERLRLVYAILTSTSKGSDVSTPPPPPLGLTPLPHPPSFPRVTAIFPPQDLAFNSNWLKKWSSASHIVSIPPEELTSIKDHFGETVALYFAFLRFYFFALIFPATMGVVFWLAGLEFNGIYAIGIVGWSVIFVESWRLKEQELAVEWGTYGVHKVEKQRPEFKGESKVVDPITGVERDYFPWYQTSARELATIPLFLVFATALACLISVIYAIETVVEEVYSGAGKKYLALVPTVLFAGVVPQFTALWDCTAARLTGWENHRKQTNYARSLALKVFGLNFFVAYGSLILTSYIYIPFGGFLVPWILSFIPQHEASFSSSAAYSIDTSKLHTQIIAFTLTDQKVAEVRSSGPKVTDDEEEHAFLQRVRDEATLPPYDVFSDYSEMALQFGYLALFSVIWPIAPLWSFVNNFVELRSDAFKLTSQSQRPIPTRDASIGPWLEALGFITWLAALTNASLVYLYRPQTYTTATSSLLSSLSSTNLTAEVLSSSSSLMANGTIGLLTSYTNLAQNGEKPTAMIKATLFSALLVALATEHGYLVARMTVRYVLKRTVWDGSRADVKLRGTAHELRRAYLDEMEGPRDGPAVVLARRSGEEEAAKEVDGKDEGEKAGGKFWGRGDRGLEEIRRRTKVE